MHSGFCNNFRRFCFCASLLRAAGRADCVSLCDAFEFCWGILAKGLGTLDGGHRVGLFVASRQYTIALYIGFVGSQRPETLCGIESFFTYWQIGGSSQEIGWLRLGDG